jgi:hypothetical protein
MHGQIHIIFKHFSLLCKWTQAFALYQRMFVCVCVYVCVCACVCERERVLCMCLCTAVFCVLCICLCVYVFVNIVTCLCIRYICVLVCVDNSLSILRLPLSPPSLSHTYRHTQSYTHTHTHCALVCVRLLTTYFYVIIN